MTKEKVKEVLNIRNNNFYRVIDTLVSYVNVYENKVVLLNAIVLKAKENKSLTSLDMFKYFYEELESLVINTVYCPSKYNAQMLLKSVWEKSLMQSYVVQQIRQGYKIIELQKNDIPENETDKQQRLRLQAERMRVAKAKKAAEKKAIEDANKQKKQEQQIKSQKINKEYEEQIRLLRNLKI